MKPPPKHIAHRRRKPKKLTKEERQRIYGKPKSNAGAGWSGDVPHIAGRAIPVRYDE